MPPAELRGFAKANARHGGKPKTDRLKLRHMMLPISRCLKGGGVWGGCVAFDSFDGSGGFFTPTMTADDGPRKKRHGSTPLETIDGFDRLAVLTVLAVLVWQHTPPDHLAPHPPCFRILTLVSSGRAVSFSEFLICLTHSFAPGEGQWGQAVVAHDCGYTLSRYTCRS